MADRVLEQAVGEHRQHRRDELPAQGVPDRERAAGAVLGGNGEHGPVPKVQRVRNEPDPLARPQTQDALGPVARRGDATANDQGGAHDGQGDRRAGVRRRRRKGDGGDDDEAESAPRHRRGHPSGQAPQAGGREGDEASECELPHPREGRKVRRRLVRRGLDDREGERGHHRRAEHDGEAPAQRHPHRQTRHDEEDGGIDQVELFFDGERPVVLQDRGRQEGRQVVRARAGEMHVDQEERGPPGIARALRAPQGAEHDIRGHDGDDDDQGGGGDDAPDPPGVEASDRRLGRRGPLSEQDAGDHEARDHEEDVHPHVAPAHARDVGVEQQDERDGDGPQALDVGAEPSVLGRGARLVTRGLEARDGRRLVVDQQFELATRPSTRALLSRTSAGRRVIAGGK